MFFGEQSPFNVLQLCGYVFFLSDKLKGDGGSSSECQI